ncbi:MAG: carboxypeptidase-like regulatory domain-containing protein, partial [Bacteroidetes bacterium]|nr:carboxypeptidase-like regulatory domain-containing protein [Bacteroidota bacterium]
MLRKIILLFITSVTVCGVFAQSGTLKGTVKDPATGEAIPFANISISKGGSIITGGMTDFDGNYTIKPIHPGTYSVTSSYVGYATKQVDGVIINSDKITFLNFDMTTSSVQLKEVVIYERPLIDPDQVSTGGSVSQEEIKKMPGRSAEAVATTVAGVYSDDGNVTSIRGAREEATVYYIDGVKVRGSNTLPKSAIEGIDVITGGASAKYGDATGGIINISTAPPGRELEGSGELVTSQFLDPYGYTLGEVFITGPLLFKTSIDKYDSTKTTRDPVAGYLFSANLSYTKDPYPSAVGGYRATDSAQAEIRENPVRQNPNGFGLLPNSFWYGSDKFEKIKSKDNVGAWESVFTGKLDYRPSTYINLAVGGTYDYQNERDYYFG